jgi:hypothetical protein
VADDGNCLFARFNWDHSALPFTMHYPYVTFKDIHILPSAEHPTGQKGLALASYWKEQGLDKYTGIVILDGDVVIDPEDFRVMSEAIDARPDIVHTAAVKLWVTTDHGYDWFWSHSNGRLTKELILEPTYFSFCFSYLPGGLLYSAMRMGVRDIVYPFVDEFVSVAATQLEIPVNVIPCEPKHVHY